MTGLRAAARWVVQTRSTQPVVGLAAAVVGSDGVEHETHGLADIASGRLFTPDTIVRVA